MTRAQTPEPPYFAVVFSSERTEGDNGYGAMAEAMQRLAASMPGYLGFESARAEDGYGITVSYWESEDAIRNWKAEARHLAAQKQGRERWYENYVVRVARVERAYAMSKRS